MKENERHPRKRKDGMNGRCDPNHLYGLESIPSGMFANIPQLKCSLILATNVFIFTGEGRDCPHLWKDN